jgi:hypothetical protein
LEVPEEPLSYTELELKPDFTYEEKPTKILEKSGNSLGIGQ